MSGLAPSGRPSKGMSRTVTDHPPAPTLPASQGLPPKQRQQQSESGTSRHSSHRSSRPAPQVIEENYSGDRGPVSVSGSRSSRSSRTSIRLPQQQQQQQQQQPRPIGLRRSVLDGLQRMGDQVVQSFHGESEVMGRGGLAGIQRPPRDGPNRHGLGPQLVKFGPHKGKPVGQLSEQEREETRGYKQRQAKKLAGSYVFT